MKTIYKIKWICFLLLLISISFKTANAQGPPPPPPPPVSVSGSNSACEGDVESYLGLIASNPSGFDYFYRWSIWLGTVEVTNLNTSQNGNLFNVAWDYANVLPIINYQIRLNVVDAANNNIFSSPPFFSKNVQVYPKPTPNITSSNTQICQVIRNPTKPQVDGDNTCYKVCVGSNFVFSTPFVLGNTYSWSAINSNGQPLPQISNPNIAEVAFSFAGSASISVTETNSFGCTKTYEKCILVVDPPIANFSTFPAFDAGTNTLEICSGTTVNFTNLSTPALNDNIISWNWNFGNGIYANTPNAEHIFTNTTSGDIIRNVVLTIVNGCGCSASKSVAITVKNTPVPDIQCISTLCPSTLPESYTIANLPPSCNTINWSAVGGSISGPDNIANVNVVWGNGNTGSGELTVQISCPGICNLPYTALVPIVATQGQIVGDQTPCAGENIVYQLPNVPGTSYNWTVSFGASGLQGQSANQFVVNFNNSGSYSIVCNYYNSFLGCGGVSSYLVNVLGRLELISSGKHCSGANSSSSNTNLILTNDPSQSYYWNVTDIFGGAVSFSGLSFPVNSVNFPPAGVNWPAVLQQTQLVVSATNINFCNSTQSQVITLFPQPPAVTTITDPGCFCPGSPVTYSAINSNSQFFLEWEFTNGLPTDANGNAATVSWNPGASNYEVLCYQVMAQEPHCQSQAYVLPVAACVAPTAANLISGSTSACVNSTSQFTFLAGVTNAIITISPQLSGSLVLGNSTVPNFSIQWNNQIGTATIIIEYKFCNGQNITVTKTVQITAPPSPVISGPTNFCQGSSVPFTLAPSSGSTLGTQISWFLDGSTTSIGSNSTLSPNNIAAGNHILIAKWFNSSCSSFATSATFAFTANEAPIVGLSNGFDFVCPYNTAFNGLLTGIVSNSANVGNCTFNWNGISSLAGIASTPNGFTSIFTASNASISGPISISLMATSSSSGCSTTSASLILSCTTGGCGGPVPMTFNYTQNCGQVNITSVNCVSCNSTNFNYQYPLPPTTTSITTGNTATFTQAGSFPVKIFGTQTVGGNTTCSAWSLQTIEIPLVINPSSALVCGLNTAAVYSQQLNGNVTNMLGVTNITHNWSITGPSGISMQTSANPLLPLAAGDYTAILTVNATFNGNTIACTKTTNFTMPQRPNPAFTITPLSLLGQSCPGIPLAFTITNPNQANILLYTWNYDDGSSSNVPNVSYHTFSPFFLPLVGGLSYNTQLTLNDVRGCASSSTFNFEVGDPTYPSLAIGSIINCVNVPAILTTNVNASANPPPYIYNWQNIAASPNSNTAQVYETGSYSVSITNGSGCISQTEYANVTLNPIPSIVLNGSTIYCHGEETNISIFGGTTHTYLFKVYFNGSPTSGLPSTTYTGSTLAFDVNYNNAPYTVVAAVENNYGCQNTKTFTINVIAAPPSPNIIFNGNSCLTNGSVAMQVQSPNLSLYTYIWNNGNVSITNTGQSSGGYFCFAIDNASQCRSLASSALVLQTGPNFSSMITGCYQIECNETRELTVQNGFTNYQWYSNGNLIIGALENNYTVATSGIFYVVVTDLNGCSYTSPTVDIEVLDCPAVCCNNIIAYTSNLVCYEFRDGQWIYTFDLVVNNLNANLYPFTFECAEGIIDLPVGYSQNAPPGISIFQGLKFIDTGVPDPAFCMCLLFDQGDGTFCCLNSCSQLPDCDRLPPPNCEGLRVGLREIVCKKISEIYFNEIYLALENNSAMAGTVTISLASTNGNLLVTGNSFAIAAGQAIVADMVYNDVLPFVNEFICLNIDVLYQDGSTCREVFCFKLDFKCITNCDLSYTLINIDCLPKSAAGNSQYQITIKIGHPAGANFWGTFTSPLGVISNIQPNQLNPTGTTTFTFNFEDFSNSQGNLIDFTFILGRNIPYIIRCKFNFLIELPNCNEPSRQSSQSEIKVSPNPALNNISISYHNRSTNTATININNALGQTIQILNANVGSAIINQNIQKLPAGMYYVVLMSNNGQLANNKFQIVNP